MSEPSGNKIHLNLDALEKEDPKSAFRFVLEGHEFVLEDPTEVSWQELQQVRTPVDFARYCMSSEDRRKFLAIKMPGWKFNRLFEEYQEHFGLDTAGNAPGSRT